MEQTSTGKQVKLLDKNIKDVRYEVNSDANMSDEEDEEEDEDMEPDGKLLIGDSLISAIQSKRDDMSVECQRRAHFMNMRNTIKKMTTKKPKLYSVWDK